ncbi:MAG: hypothetical protein IKB90_06295 [Alistipes sp.]|nr:hypothetical protein [Alistipes sp.]
MNKKHLLSDGCYDAPALDALTVKVESGFALSSSFEDIPEKDADDEF